jgi:hypothetical protein
MRSKQDLLSQNDTVRLSLLRLVSDEGRERLRRFFALRDRNLTHNLNPSFRGSKEIRIMSKITIKSPPGGHAGLVFN